MNDHLSSAAMDQALAGELAADVSAHLNGCDPCAAELRRMRALLPAFREQAQEGTRKQLQYAKARAVAHQQSSRLQAPRWIWAAATAVLAAAVAISPMALRHRAVTARPFVARTAPNAANTMSDDALLSSVQNDLSSSVPEPLLPLTDTSTYGKQTPWNK